MPSWRTREVIKAFRYHEDGRPRFLFHGNSGSLVVPLDKWIQAEERQATDGSGTTVYLSGFHSFGSEDCLEAWLKTTTHHHVVVRGVLVRATRRKEHSRHPDVVLSRWLYVPSEAWRDALAAHRRGLELSQLR